MVVRTFAAFLLTVSVSISAAYAQALRVLDRPLSEGVLLPPTSVATQDGPLSAVLNPAGLAAGPGGFVWLHEEGSADLESSRRGDGLFLQLGGLSEGDRFAQGLALAVEWLRPYDGECAPDTPCPTRTSLAYGVGGPRFSVGAVWRWYSSAQDADIDAINTLDAGVMYRPAQWLSLGLVGAALNGPRVGGEPIPRLYTLGVGVRPFGPRLTLAGDASVNDRDGFDQTRLSWLAAVRVIDGLDLLGQVAHGVDGGDVAVQLGLRLGFGHAAITGSAAGVDPGLTDRTAGLFVLEARNARGPSLFRTPEAQVLEVSEALEGPGLLSRLLSREPRLDPAAELTLRLQRMARDPDLDTLVLQLRKVDGLSFGRVEELRGQLFRLRSEGRRVIVWMESGGDTEYYLASAADQIYAAPQSLFEINGLASGRFYLLRLLENLGIVPEFIRAGDYKSAPEQLTRDSASEAAADNIHWLLDDQFDRYVKAIAEARGMEPDRVREILDEGLLTSERAVEVGLMDGTAMSGPGLNEAIRTLTGRRLPQRKAGPPTRAPEDWGPLPAIAIVEVRGAIVPGDAGPTRQVAAADRVVRALRRATRDPGVKAIVLRVESPGGDVGASELIYQAVRQARDKKPVIASMGDVAASGGYYVAAAADAIVADASTLTGSIGVFAGKVDLSALLSTIGVTTEVFRRGERADILTVTRPWTEGERDLVRRQVDGFYEVFLERVAEGRGMSRDEVHAVAAGRVWTGAQALERGLVDELGGIDRALVVARERAGLDDRGTFAVIGARGAFQFPSAPGQPFAPPAGALARVIEQLGGRHLMNSAHALSELLDGRPLALALDLPQWH